MKLILGSDSLTVFCKGVPYNVNRESKIFEAALAAVRADDEEAFLQVVQVKKNIVSAFSAEVIEDITIQNNCIMYNGREITGLIATRILEMKSLQLSLSPLFAFIRNLMKNPSKRAVDEAFNFVDACDLPLTEDGCILAYRRIREDYFDMHSGTVLNKPASLMEDEEIQNFPIKNAGKQKEVTVEIIAGETVISMDRNLVDEDKDTTCSQGLHCCSYEYLKSFAGSRTVVVKINPADIVAVPSDYNNAKMRVCRYTIVDELKVDSSGIVEKKLDNNFVKEQLDRNASIKRDLAAGDTVTEVAKTYGISRRQVARIRDK